MRLRLLICPATVAAGGKGGPEGRQAHGARWHGVAARPAAGHAMTAAFHCLQQGAGSSSGLPLGCHSYYAALGTGRAPERAQRYPRCHMLSASPLQWRPPMLTTRSCSSAATRGRTTWRWAQARCARCGRRARRAPRCPSPGAWLLPAGDWRWQPGLPRLGSQQGWQRAEACRCTLLGLLGDRWHWDPRLCTPQHPRCTPMYL